VGRRDEADEGRTLHPMHVVVAAGTPTEWARFGVPEWSRRLDDLADGATGAGWVTLVPHHGPQPTPDEVARVRDGLVAVGARATDPESPVPSLRHHRNAPGRPSVIVEPMADGRARFADTVERLRREGCDPAALDESMLSRALLAPAPVEPDLVVVLGPSDVLPTSLVWELAYSELVFLDSGWEALRSDHLRIAVDDFARRTRRFGGIDP